jgi:hypothetical protein
MKFFMDVTSENMKEMCSHARLDEEIERTMHGSSLQKKQETGSECMVMTSVWHWMECKHNMNLVTNDALCGTQCSTGGMEPSTQGLAQGARMSFPQGEHFV